MLNPPRAYLYLDAVARAGSIRKAAEKLHVASTALNRMILELEEQAGTPLFERLPRGVRLTAAGEVLVHTVRRSLSDLRSAQSQIEQLRGLVRGTVRLGCAESVATDLVPSAIVQYQSQHPGVQFQVVSGVTNHLVQLLGQDEVELVLVHDPAPSDDLQVISRLHQPLCAMVRPDHPLAERSSLRLTDCQQYPVALGDRSFGSRRLLDAVMARSRITLRPMIEASTVQLLKEFTRQTGAISFQFEIGTLQEARRGELVSIPLVDAALGRSELVLAVREGRRLPSATLSFVELLVSRLAEITP
ncbi:MAG: LysR family transcriptional regulator [Hydrogenophaga sp.]|uniref:LysR family transcriptional regulator n=1 Tax=Hydrogenophaga sp. TaxID=1904254 RepID=UPI002725A446|nr:LysR family transcriptional regulator [Hydrogenophaga sp.]MDO9131634.1 LysR family transcriptional regulator [Hydrogenophaga sp.]MDP3203161.1 LysR family transcriptional regulator [Hydrogenophaga sp.]MDZ4283802.1 LysR family transcriptional regulator [Hydrogenophaga sp.]